MLRAPSSQYIYPILHSLQEGILVIYRWILAFVQSVFNANGELHSLMPLFVIGIAVSIILVAFLIIRRVIWS